MGQVRFDRKTAPLCAFFAARRLQHCAGMRKFWVCVATAGACVAGPCSASPFGDDSGTGAATGQVTGTCDVAPPADPPRSIDRADDREALWRSAAALAWRQPAATARSRHERDEGVAAVSAPVIDRALDEMLRGPNGRVLRWTQAPELVVLTSVMEYQSGAHTEYQATSERLTDAEANDLVADLNGALALLTGETFTQFAAIRLEPVPAGTTASVMRAGQIVVGRYRGVRDRLDTIGLGGRFGRSGGTISGGSIVLDNDYDRTSSRRRLLRTHELGHALGYNHVESRMSIMNTRIGAEPTEFDRRAALMAFQGGAIVGTLGPCREP